METLKTGLLVIVLLVMIIFAGCQQGYSKRASKVNWEPTPAEKSNFSGTNEIITSFIYLIIKNALWLCEPNMLYIYL